MNNYTDKAKTLLQLLTNTGAEFEDENGAVDIIEETLKNSDLEVEKGEIGDYIPFGPEWEKEVLKMRKPDIMQFYKRSAAKVLEMEPKLKDISTTLDSLHSQLGSQSNKVFRGELREKAIESISEILG